jgi:hypothetical protein
MMHFRLEKLRVTQAAKKFFSFYWTIGSLPFSKELANGPYPKPDEYNIRSHVTFLEFIDTFNN